MPRPLEETFAFFSDAQNLDALTPSSVGFEILTPVPIEMRAGTLIDYRIRMYGVPVQWKTEIIVWDPPHCFVDLQLRGPYRWWHHEHRFEACAQGTRILDTVEYRAPLPWFSHRLLVNREVNRIFDFRTLALQRELGTASSLATHPG